MFWKIKYKSIFIDIKVSNGKYFSKLFFKLSSPIFLDIYICIYKYVCMIE